ncbi:MAG: pyridoxal phosphate-dependent aminotransferase [Solirubrobacteraceae bacterium]
MGLLDYYRQFEGMADAEVSAELRARAQERRRRALARIDPLDLSATTWHEFPHPDVVAAITYAARRGINRAPDPGTSELRRELGHRHGLEADRVAVGNGASELLVTATRELMGAGDELVTPWPSYPLYPLMARWAGGRAVPVHDGHDPEALLSAVTERTRVVALCNPNDPTGAYLAVDRLRDLLERLPDGVTVLLDEALGDFVDAEPPGASLGLLDDFPGLLTFRSFSKAYGLAGMRCGYVLGGPGSETLIDRLHPALGISDVVQAGALDAVRKCGPLVARRREVVAAERRRAMEALAELPLDVFPSQANFLWLSARGLSGHELSARLGRSRVIVYIGGEIGSPDHVRVALQSPPATDRLLEALRQALAA